MGIFSGKHLTKAGIASFPQIMQGDFMGAISSASGALESSMDAEQQFRYQKKLNAEQMAFEERMSNTAHQREVKDLEAAGLNPILSANAGASTPAGSAGSAPQVDTTGKALMALEKEQMKAQIKNETDATKSQIQKNNAEIETQNAIKEQYKNETEAIKRENDFWLENPTLYKIKKGAEALAPIINTASGIVRTGAGMYGAGKIGKIAKKFTSSKSIFNDTRRVKNPRLDLEPFGNFEYNQGIY